MVAMAVTLETHPSISIPAKDSPQKEEIKVRSHLANFLPWATITSNQRLAGWVKEASYNDGVEWIGLGLRDFPLGPTHEIKVKSLEVLSEITPDIKSAHATFNPYATFWGIVARQPDRLVPEKPYPPFLLALASNNASQEAIKKLEKLKEDLRVVTYSALHGEDIWGQYRHPLIQTGGFIYDKLTPREIIEQVRKGIYDGVCVDLTHMREQASDGTYPFLPWQETLEKFWQAGVLTEVHVQAGRPKEEERGGQFDNFEELKAFLSGTNYRTELDQMVRFLKQLGFRGPYVTEINPLALRRLKGVKELRPHNLIEIHQEIVDHVKRT